MARRTRLLAVAVAVVVAAASLAAVRVLGDGSSSAATTLARRLSEGGDPQRFRFQHQAGGTRVLDCFLPNRAVEGTVDNVAGVAVLRGENGTEVARKSPEGVLLHQSLFAADAIPTPWLSVALPPTDELRAVLTKTLGTELSGYVLVPGLPPSGTATASAALEAAEEVERLGTTTVDDRRTDRYRITVADDEFADATSTPTAAADQDGRAVPVPVIDVWVDARDQVVRVTVVAGGSNGSGEETPGGWTIDYEVPVPPPTQAERMSATDAADLPLDRLAARQREGCEVPL